MRGRWIRLDTTWSSTGWVAALPPEARLAWVELQCHAKAHGFNGCVTAVPPGVAARRWDVTRNAVDMMLEAAANNDELKTNNDEWMLIRWHETQTDENAAGRMRRYRQRTQDFTELSTSDDDEVTRNARNVTPVTPTETETETETEEKNIIIPAKKDDGFTPEFLEWWKLYPSRGKSSNPKRLAFRAYLKALKHTPAITLLAGVKRHAASCGSEGISGTAIVPQAATWLNQRRWEDDDAGDANPTPRTWR